MGQDALTPSQYIERQEQILRDQLNEGCRLARELDERVKSIPAGKLCMGSDHTDAAASSSAATHVTHLRWSVAKATSDVVATFSKAVQLLLRSSSCGLDQSTALSAASSPLQNALHSPPQPKATTSFVLSSVKAITLAAGQAKSPPLSPPAGKHRTAPSVLHRASPSHPGMIHSPLLSATSEMSDGSPIQPDLPVDEATTANPRKAEICRKRKLQPKLALKMPAPSNTGTADPNDGHAWRKYGQKNILGSQYPRSYYRCTRKPDTGCPAIKKVQRCDEDESFFDVVYQGYHTCRSAELDRQCWPFAFPQAPSNLLYFQANMSPASFFPAGAPSLLLANMDQRSAAVPLRPAHQASVDNRVAHQRCPVGSPAFPFCCPGDVSVSDAFTANSDKLSAGAECNIASCLIQPYQVSSGKALLDHLHPLFISNRAAAMQDGSCTKDRIARGMATQGPGYVDGEEALSCLQYKAQQEEPAFNPLAVWHELENNSEEVYTDLTRCYNQATAAHRDERLPPSDQSHGSLLFHEELPASMAQLRAAAAAGQQDASSPHCGSLHEQDDVAAAHSSALGFDSMTSADDVLAYLHPSL